MLLPSSHFLLVHGNWALVVKLLPCNIKQAPGLIGVHQLWLDLIAQSMGALLKVPFEILRELSRQSTRCEKIITQLQLVESGHHLPCLGCDILVSRYKSSWLSSALDKGIGETLGNSSMMVGQHPLQAGPAGHCCSLGGYSLLTRGIIPSLDGSRTLGNVIYHPSPCALICGILDRIPGLQYFCIIELPTMKLPCSYL